MPAPPQDRAHLPAIFAISLALLAYQIVLTRVFSVIFYGHFAFFGISLAMLGLTVGAVRVFLDERRFAAAALPENWAATAFAFALSSVAAVLSLLYLPLIVPGGLRLQLAVVALLVFIAPFSYGGLCVTLILTKSSAPIGRLYAADLLGAALAAVGIAVLLFVLDPITIVLALAALVAGAGWLMARGLAAAGRLRLAGAGLALATLVQGGLYLADLPHLGVVWSKIDAPEASLFERWNAISLVRVTPATDVVFGWGFGRPPRQTHDQLYLDIDHNAGTVISRFDGDIKPFGFLADDVINFGYLVRPVRRAVVIGVGGGRDILSALSFGVERVTGIELNPSIFEVLTKRFAGYSGHLDQRPDVTLVEAEARSWLNQSRQRFDLVQVSLIDTWAATAAGGLSLSEDKLYTREAWRDFADRLDADGMLEVSRWFKPGTHPGEFYRVLSLAVDTLEARGVPAAELRQHILAIGGGPVASVLVSLSPFTAEELARARAAAEAHGFVVLLDPDTAIDETAATIGSGRADAAFYAALPWDVTAPGDDRPFFFQMRRLGGLFGRNSAEESVDGLSLTVVLLFATSLALIHFVFVPLLRRRADIPTRLAVPHLVYFGAIGLGFMLVEISQMERLMIFLGHPIYGLTVVLFSLLLFGGLGSATVRGTGRWPLWLRPLACCLVLAAIGFATAPVAEAGSGLGTIARILLSVALLAPAGFVMGMMFPVGMLLSAGCRNLQPWFWGINGATSVLASILGIIISMTAGIAATYWSGLACYLICLPIAIALSRWAVPAPLRQAEAA